MPSLIPGYEYDIFISYRQKDNKLDGWVTDFVEHLKSELDATFKDDISVYFDINPHDGLQEMHYVEASIEPKLRSLIFIPILSRTYCDPASFAWQHEFKEFVTLASKDKFGLSVRLSNGNVAGRVLPIRIYDLDKADVKLCEEVVNSTLRGVEFIYKSSGVNRPLRSKEENPGNNLNQTLYRDQINKVALAIEEILSALRSKVVDMPESSARETAAPEPIIQKKALKKNRSKIAWLIIILIIFSGAGYLFLPKVFRAFSNGIGSKNEAISIAVLPFLDDSPNKEQSSYFINGLMDEIIDKLAKIPELSVKARTEVEQYRNSRLGIKEIAGELGVKYVLEGSGQKAGDSIRIRIQLIDSKDGSHIWSKPYEARVSDSTIFTVQQKIAFDVAKQFQVRVSTEAMELIKRTPTENMTAYDLYLQAQEHGIQAQASKKPWEEINKSKQLFEDAIRLDPSFAEAYEGLASVYTGALYFVPDIDLSEKYLDSGKIYLDKARLLGIKPSYVGYYEMRGMADKAEELLEEEYALKPKGEGYYSQLSALYNVREDYFHEIEYFLKAKELRSSTMLIYANEPGDMSLLFSETGFPDLARKYADELLSFTNDKVRYLRLLADEQTMSGNYKQALQYYLQANMADSTNPRGISVFWEPTYSDQLYPFLRMYYMMRDYASAGRYLSGFEKGRCRIEAGAMFLREGKKEIAMYHLNGVKERQLKEIHYQRYNARNYFSHLQLARIYAILKDKKTALEYLHMLKNRESCPLYLITMLKDCPDLDFIRKEPEFTSVLNDMEDKYERDHKRIEKLLRKHELIQ